MAEIFLKASNWLKAKDLIAIGQLEGGRFRKS